ncbi:MarR family winged helix-turn-helix transcriptional regulator [Leptothoe sp. PORK10 BA2]|jgi:DNA-binding MarR family transcriptional regulator|uniref:MarR family winged helix-turn-helix transcriptional regulator n=1 Tax=Leptothoe sp. PORK10 BA2 TaxID=3110254 RepID=UPI002B203728|nr:MarR family winged helix-turn-helix transcriptional regulator [Leptothoe sp. PORK10 BA2]MEA5466470.1 MarR family winged helix-turn-helix transcriptional regulator [Leptothoe sp. PORK10 BA2]
MMSPYGTPKEIARQITNDCIARRLRQINRMVTRLYDDALRPLGFTINQLNILATIVSRGPISPGQLGQMLGMEKSTISRTLDRMCKHGWIDIGPGKDKRSQSLKATPTGRQLLITAAPVWQALQANVLDSTAEHNGLLAVFGITAQDGDAASDGNGEDDFYGDDFAADFYGQ